MLTGSVRLWMDAFSSSSKSCRGSLHPEPGLVQGLLPALDPAIGGFKREMGEQVPQPTGRAQPQVLLKSAAIDRWTGVKQRILVITPVR